MLWVTLFSLPVAPFQGLSELLLASKGGRGTTRLANVLSRLKVPRNSNCYVFRHPTPDGHRGSSQADRETSSGFVPVTTYFRHHAQPWLAFGHCADGQRGPCLREPCCPQDQV